MVDKVKPLYRQLCEAHPIPIFQQAWWMDAVCVKGDWDVFIYQEKEEVIAAMPFHQIKKWGLRWIIQPQLTPYNGVWMNPKLSESFRTRYEIERRAYTYLIEQLENHRYDFYLQSFHPSFTNWLPFYWKGFRQRTRYSFVIHDISHPQEVYNAFSERKRRDIKKAMSSLNVSLNITPSEFYDFHKRVLQKRKQKISYPFELFKRIADESLARQQGMILSATDNKNQLHAALFVVWDQASAYCLVYAIDEEFKNSGALSLLIWEAIQFLSDKTSIFDLEGSMIQSVADSYVQFSDTQIPYFELYKANFWIDFLWNLKEKR